MKCLRIKIQQMRFKTNFETFDLNTTCYTVHDQLLSFSQPRISFILFQPGGADEPGQTHM